MGVVKMPYLQFYWVVEITWNLTEIETEIWKFLRTLPFESRANSLKFLLQKNL